MSNKDSQAVADMLASAEWADIQARVTALAGTTGTDVPPQNPDNPGAYAQLLDWMTASEVDAYNSTNLGYMVNTLKIKGLALANQRLVGLGGSDNWTANASTPLTGAYAKQGAITSFVPVARTAGITKLFLSSWVVNYNYSAGHHVPWADWFDDATWTNTVLPAIQNWAGAAKLMGFDGVMFDGEMYAGDTGTPSWNWAYTGNTHTQNQVKAQAKIRGAQIMTAILAGFPNAEVMTYFFYLDGSFNALLQHVVNSAGLTDNSVNQTTTSVVDGMTSVKGYSNFRILDAAFYYGSQIGGSNESTCVMIGANGTMAALSSQLSNWSYANSRISTSPLVWMGPTNGDGSGGSQQRTTAAATARVAAANPYGMSGWFGNYVQTGDGPVAKNYNNFVATTGSSGNFEPSYQSQTTGIFDTTDPTLSSIVVTRDDTNTCHATGTANDNLGIRAIRWVCGANNGAAVHTFVPDTTITPHSTPVADYTKTPGTFAFHITWTASGILATAGQTITFYVEDIKGRVVPYNQTAPA